MGLSVWWLFGDFTAVFCIKHSCGLFYIAILIRVHFKDNLKLLGMTWIQKCFHRKSFSLPDVLKTKYLKQFCRLCILSTVIPALSSVDCTSYLISRHDLRKIALEFVSFFHRNNSWLCNIVWVFTALSRRMHLKK